MMAEQRFFFRLHKLKLVTALVKSDSNTVGLTSGVIQCKTTSVITRSSNDEAIKKKPIKQSKDFFSFYVK